MNDTVSMETLTRGGGMPAPIQMQPRLPMQTETASTAAAAQAKAMVEARYTLAQYRPRNWDQVRQDTLRECRRPSFAHNKSAYYRKPIGDGVEGLGIRFVEVALRCMTNVLVETSMVFEDDTKEIHRVSVTDLESNLTYPLDVRVSKTVERSKPMDDGSYISVRKNSRKNNVYTVPATEDDLLNKRMAQISKAIRTLGLRIIPGDIQDEAEYLIKKVRLDEAAKDPDAERKRVADVFSTISVKVGDLEEYLGHGLDACSPAELVDLRGIYGAIKDGEATWKSVMENKAEQETFGKKPKDDPKNAAKGGAMPSGAAGGIAQQHEGAGAPIGGTVSVEQLSSGPTADDAMALIEKGDIEGAQDIASSLPADQQQQVYSAIGKAKRGSPRGGMSMD